MIVHYSIAAELASQRQQQLAHEADSYRRARTASRRRWWEPGFLHHPNTATEAQSPTPRPVPATA